MKPISTFNKNNFYSNLIKLESTNVRDYKENSDLIKFSRYYLYFMIYSFAGWIWENIFMLIVDGIFQERGFLHIPICSIYGFATLLILFLFYKKNYPWRTIFFGSAFATCILEFLTSWEMEKLFHRTWWDYSGWIFNYQGRVSLLTSIAFGMVSILVVNWIHPYLCGVLDKYLSLKISMKVSFVLLTITTMDFIFTALIRLK